MALKTLLLRKQIDNKKKELKELRTKDFSAREAELMQAIEEVENEEQRAEIENLVTEFDAEKAEHDKAVSDLAKEIEELESDLAAEEEAQNTEPPAASEPAPVENERKGEKEMNTRELVPAMTKRDRIANIVTRDDVKDYLSEIRTAIKEKRTITNAGLTIPDVMLELIREEVAEASKLLPYVNLQAVTGTARQNVLGAAPEGVWTEMCANLNELDIAFNQIEVDGFMVGGYFALCNAVLTDSDVNMVAEIVRALGGAIAKGIDKAILYGKGTKMPTGIVTRLAQTSQPANWGAAAPTWTDLHETNVLKLDLAAAKAPAFFQELVGALGVAKPKYSSDGVFWVMNRKTHLDILGRALAFNSNAALVSNTEMMPILGGAVIEIDNIGMADYEIIGGFGKNYLMAEREGAEFANSDIPRFLQSQTVFKGTARYDGKPVAGEAFVIVNYANQDPTTTMDFAPDTANT